jgi:hypothetical protein
LAGDLSARLESKTPPSILFNRIYGGELTFERVSPGDSHSATMSAFLDPIAQRGTTAAMLGAFTMNPFQNVTLQAGGPMTLFGFHLDRGFVQPESVKKFQKCIKYVPFNEISARLTSRTNSTMVCICDIRGDCVLLCDLHSTKHVSPGENFPPFYQRSVIATTNDEIRKDM